MQHIVFRITGVQSPLVYIGYHVKDAVDTMGHFLVGATRSDERKDREFLELQGADPSQLTITVLSVEDDELDAFNARNDARASDPQSFTAPSRWPMGVYERAMKESPDKVTQSFAQYSARQLPTARDAWGAKLWPDDKMKALTKTHDRAMVLRDLDVLSPNAFETKYGV